MHRWYPLPILLILTICTASQADDSFEEQRKNECAVSKMQVGKDGWCVPTFELEGDRKEIFSINDCEWISGLTCRVRYNGRKPLPSEVFFAELDAKGKRIGPTKTRLIYPRLDPGKGGVAIFRIHGTPTRIVMTGTWKGPLIDPY